MSLYALSINYKLLVYFILYSIYLCHFDCILFVQWC